MYNSTVQSNPTKVKTGGFFSCVVMHTREKLGKQANKEQVRISSHFIVYNISRELNYKKPLQNSMLYISVTSQKMCKNLNEKNA